MKYILIFLSIIPLTSTAQTFFVDGKDVRSREHVKSKIQYEGYKVVDSAKADYTVQLLIDGTYKVISLKQPYKGYIKIIDNTRGG